ncbi:MAG: hypothetical protein AB1793_08085 [Candidatus Thermoplasmatota archaeon]
MGLVYCPNGRSNWSQHSALTPTPIQLEDDKIRVYAGMRDNTGASRIGYVDVDADKPSRIVAVSDSPVLDVGLPGCFDDNGVILGDIAQLGRKLLMYYVGFQLVEKVKFLAFSGLAVSVDGGERFQRCSNTPILDRSDDGLYIRAIHSVLRENGIWRAWCGVGSGWETIGGKPYPRYNIRLYESRDGIHFPDRGTVCIDNTENEYRIGRPRVVKDGDTYCMFYTKGTLTGDYIPGYAESKDGISWIRKDSEAGISLSKEGWDSKHLCYPATIRVRERTIMFYNGNDMGRTGFGYAELEI